MLPPQPRSTLFPYTTLFRSHDFGAPGPVVYRGAYAFAVPGVAQDYRSEEHTSELQSRFDLVCRLLLEKKNGDARHSSSRVVQCLVKYRNEIKPTKYLHEVQP